MITTEDARQELSDAITAFAQIETLTAKASTQDVGIAWAAARARIEAANAQLARAEEDDRLRAEVAAARAEAEETTAKANSERAERLADSRARIVAALTTAQDALSDTLAAVGDHNALLAETVGEMSAAGLTPLIDEHSVGCDPRARIARLDGESWRELDGLLLLDLAARRVRHAQLDPAGYALHVRRFGTSNMVERVAADVLARVPAPELAEPHPNPWAAVPRPVVVSQPVRFASEWARQEAERRREQAVEVFSLKFKPGPDGKPLPSNHPAYKVQGY